MTSTLDCHEDFNEYNRHNNIQAPSPPRIHQPSSMAETVDRQLIEPTLLYMLRDEHKFCARPDYLAQVQGIGGIKAWMRNSLIEWVAEVCDHYGLGCLILAVNVIDRFLSCRRLAPGDLQLFGGAAMLVASKLKDEESPTLTNICACAENGFGPETLQEAETIILHALEWKLQAICTDEIFEHFLHLIDMDEATRSDVRKYGTLFMEMILLDNEFLWFPQSVIATAAMINAQTLLSYRGVEQTFMLVQHMCNVAGAPMNLDELEKCQGLMSAMFDRLLRERDPQQQQQQPPPQPALPSPCPSMVPTSTQEESFRPQLQASHTDELAEHQSHQQHSFHPTQQQQIQYSHQQHHHHHHDSALHCHHVADAAGLSSPYFSSPPSSGRKRAYHSDTPSKRLKRMEEDEYVDAEAETRAPSSLSHLGSQFLCEEEDECLYAGGEDTQEYIMEDSPSHVRAAAAAKPMSAGHHSQDHHASVLLGRKESYDSSRDSFGDDSDYEDMDDVEGMILEDRALWGHNSVQVPMHSGGVAAARAAVCSVQSPDRDPPHSLNAMVRTLASRTAPIADPIELSRRATPTNLEDEFAGVVEMQVRTGPVQRRDRAINASATYATPAPTAFPSSSTSANSLSDGPAPSRARCARLNGQML